MTPRSDKLFHILVTAWLWTLILPLAQAEEGDIVIGRDVPSRIAYRDAPPGQAMTASASPRSQIYSALGIGNGSTGIVSSLGRELSATEIGAVSATVVPGQAGSGSQGVSAAIQTGMAGAGLLNPVAAGSPGGSLSAASGSIAATVARSTAGIGDTLKGALAPLGNLK